MGAVEDEIRTADRSGSPLSVLLVELEEADRLEAVGSAAEVSATFGRFAQAVRSAVRRQDILACETDTRAWIIARDTGRLGAQALGARIVGAVRAAEPWRGAPMSVSVGLAVLGDDGRDHTSLIEAAEESRFAAAASGLGVEDLRPDHEQPGPQPAG
jgi:GGDEF domain-containing protein